MSNTATALSLRDITAETAIAIRGTASDYLVSPRDIVEWVAPTAPLGEAKKFLLVCQTAGLNPLLGDIDLLQLGGKWQAVVRKNGYLKCARRDPDYDGHESGVTIQAFEKTPKGIIVKKGPFHDIPGTIVPDGHLLIGGWCKLYRKGISRPFFKRVSFAEYNKGGEVNGPWRKLPATMIEKVAIAHACREAIDLLAATYDESELPPVPPAVVARATIAPQAVSGLQPPWQMGATDAPQGATKETGAMLLGDRRAEVPGPIAPFSDPEILEVEAEQRQLATPEQIGRIKELMARIGMSPLGISESLNNRGVTRFEDLDQVQVSDMLSKLEHKASRVDFDPFPVPASIHPESEVVPFPFPMPDEAEPAPVGTPEDPEVIESDSH